MRAVGREDNALVGFRQGIEAAVPALRRYARALTRALVMNHWIHHRGQLSVYLRLLDVAVPSIYGPSADENPFAARV